MQFLVACEKDLGRESNLNQKDSRVFFMLMRLQSRLCQSRWFFVLLVIVPARIEDSDLSESLVWPL